MRALRADGIAVQTDDLRARNGGPHLFLDALGPDAELFDARAAAGRAAFRRPRFAPPAPVADERALHVVRVGDLARRALRDVPAVAAEHHRREAAAIQIKDGLAACGDRPLERLAESL